MGTVGGLKAGDALDMLTQLQRRGRCQSLILRLPTITVSRIDQGTERNLHPPNVSPKAGSGDRISTRKT